MSTLADGYELIFESSSEQETDRLAAALASVLAAGDVVALKGTLGAGKTRLVRGLAQAFGADRSSVSSPTFGLLQHYEGDLPLMHIDAYRLSGPEEFEQMGGPELFEPEGITFIEWSERISGSLPRQHWTVAAGHLAESRREYRISCSVRNAISRMAQLQAALSSSVPTPAT